MSLYNQQRTIIDWFRYRIARTPDRPALYVKSAGQYSERTWADVGSLVLRAAHALDQWGVSAGDRVVLMSENRLEWIVCDLALQYLSAIHVPLHARLPASQVAEQILHSGATWVIVSGPEQLAKLQATRDRLPADLPCLSFDDCDGLWPQRLICNGSQWLPERLDTTEEDRLNRHAEQHVTPQTLTTILYTSGTSGGPKGVVLSQGNLTSNAEATWPATGEREDDLKMGVLPLSHIFARVCDLYIWIVCGNRLVLAESRESVLEDCQWIRPTWINSVPYFYDQLYQQVARLADPGRRLRQLLGGRMRYCQVGGAAIGKDTFDFFWKHGVPLYPGYGLTEASPVVSVSSRDRVCWGTVGQPPPGIQVRLANDGEILTRGPHVMQGYWRDQAATDQAIRDGWLHTGDLGTWNDQGLLEIRGRKKELIVTATGQKIQPSHLETLLVQDLSIEQAFVTGDARGFPIALIFPAGSTTDDSSTVDPQTLRRWIRQRIDACLAGLARHEQIRRFALLPRPLSIEYGELTPKASLRRSQIAINWAPLLESIDNSGTKPES